MGVRVGDGSWFNHSLVGELCQVSSQAHSEGLRPGHDPSTAAVAEGKSKRGTADRRNTGRESGSSDDRGCASTIDAA